MSRLLVRRLLILGCAVIAVATVGVTAGTADGGAQLETTWAQTDAPGSNATAIRHENPESVAPTADASALERRLSADLTSRLSESARRIKAEEYETAQRVLADGYGDQLARYMEVYRTAVTTDLERVEQREALFAETAALQARHAALLAEYERVAAEYECARRDDDRGRAQHRARELRNITDDLRRVRRSLAPRYQAIDTTTDGPVATADRIIATTTTETAQQTAARVQATYTTTDVTAEASADGSFADPVRLTGRLTAADDDPPSGPVSFRVNDRAVTTTVAPDGTFSLPYRPVSAAEGPARISVAYTPDDAALYLPSWTPASTSVSQSTPTVSIADASARGRAGSPVTAAGRVTVDGTPVPNASVTLRIGGRRLAETRSDEAGNFRFDVRLPANVSAGSRTLSVAAGSAGSALAPVSDDVELTVEETPTRLTMSALRSEGTVSVTGRLVTDEQSGVGGENVVVSLNGEQRATVRTAADGRYQTSVELSNATNASGTASVRAAFDGGGTSLASATVDAALTPPGDGGLPADTRTSALGLLAGVAIVAAGGLAIYRYRRESDPAGGPPSGAVRPTAIDPAVVASPLPADVDDTEPATDTSSGSAQTGDDA